MPLPSLNQPAVKRRASSAIAVLDAHSISMSMQRQSIPAPLRRFTTPPASSTAKAPAAKSQILPPLQFTYRLVRPNINSAKPAAPQAKHLVDSVLLDNGSMIRRRCSSVRRGFSSVPNTISLKATGALKRTVSPLTQQPLLRSAAIRRFQAGRKITPWVGKTFDAR